jgi:ketosteroid isomerase-like protein
MTLRDIPVVKAEVRAAFERYEKALVANDLETLDALFIHHPDTIRFGIAENLYGIEAIQAFRAARPAHDLERQLAGTVITTFGHDTAIASTLFYRDGATGKVGRQQQTWVRTDDGWKIAAAHVSVIPDPDRRETGKRASRRDQ